MPVATNESLANVSAQVRTLFADYLTRYWLTTLPAHVDPSKYVSLVTFWRFSKVPLLFYDDYLPSVLYFIFQLIVVHWVICRSCLLFLIVSRF